MTNEFDRIKKIVKDKINDEKGTSLEMLAWRYIEREIDIIDRELVTQSLTEAGY